HDRDLRDHVGRHHERHQDRRSRAAGDRAAVGAPAAELRSMSAVVTAPLAVRVALSAALYAVLGVLIVVPLLMVVYTAFIDVLPFSGDRPAQWTLENFRTIWTPELAAASLNTLIVALGGTAIAMTLGC